MLEGPIIQSADSDSEEEINPALKRKNYVEDRQETDKRPRLESLVDDGEHRGSPTQPSNSETRCFNCGKTGHFLKDCPLPKVCLLCFFFSRPLTQLGI
jgi:hypothetical protein